MEDEIISISSEDENYDEAPGVVIEDVDSDATDPYPGAEADEGAQGGEQHGQRDPRRGRAYYRPRQEEERSQRPLHTVYRSTVNIMERLDDAFMIMRITTTTAYVDAPTLRKTPPYYEEPWSPEPSDPESDGETGEGGLEEEDVADGEEEQVQDELEGDDATSDVVDEPVELEEMQVEADSAGGVSGSVEPAEIEEVQAEAGIAGGDESVELEEAQTGVDGASNSPDARRLWESDEESSDSSIIAPHRQSRHPPPAEAMSRARYVADFEPAESEEDNGPLFRRRFGRAALEIDPSSVFPRISIRYRPGVVNNRPGRSKRRRSSRRCCPERSPRSPSRKRGQAPQGSWASRSLRKRAYSVDSAPAVVAHRRAPTPPVPIDAPEPAPSPTDAEILADLEDVLEGWEPNLDDALAELSGTLPVPTPMLLPLIPHNWRVVPRGFQLEERTIALIRREVESHRGRSRRTRFRVEDGVDEYTVTISRIGAVMVMSL